MANREPETDSKSGTEAGPEAGAIETHLSRVFLTNDRVYKLLKPVSTTFVDFADRSKRIEAAATEFRLNKRISPDVYLGLCDITEEDSGGQDRVVDKMIIMRRLPADRQLDRLLDHGDVTDHLRDVAKYIASFHAGEPPVTGADAAVASVDALAANWKDNFDVVAALAGSVIPTEEVEQARTLAMDYLAGRQDLFQQRIADGWIRDGHGDLRAEHVFCLDDGPRLIDCLAFRDDFRIADVLNDVAFLVMDIHRLAGPAAARYLIDAYDEFTGEHHPSSLAHHYVAYRASVRAKVAAIRFAQGDGSAASEARMYHRLALDHLERGRPRLVLVGGGAGVGKSTVASAVADRLAATWLRADEIRKDLANMSHDDHAFSEPGEGIYSQEFSDLVYEELLRQAKLLLGHGESVVLDASWADQHRRTQARALGEASKASVTELRCEAPTAVAKERIARRMASIYNPSDATPAIADHIAARFDDWPEAATVNTNQAVSQSIEDACGLVMTGARPASAPGPGRVQVHFEQTGLTSDSIELFLSGRRRWTVVQSVLRRQSSSTR